MTPPQKHPTETTMSQSVGRLKTAICTDLAEADLTVDQEAAVFAGFLMPQKTGASFRNAVMALIEHSVMVGLDPDKRGAILEELAGVKDRLVLPSAEPKRQFRANDTNVVVQTGLLGDLPLIPIYGPDGIAAAYVPGNRLALEKANRVAQILTDAKYNPNA